MRAAEATGRALAALGVGHAFGVVGSGNFAMTNALVAAGVPYVAARHEGGAATMADAYARIAGRPAVLSVHQGCGLTNAMTGITEAAKSRTPVIVLAADTARAAVRSNFRIDQEALVTAVGAVSERVRSADTVYADVLRACTTAVRERRTVVLNVGLDVQAEEVTTSPPAEYALPAAVPMMPDSGDLHRLAELVRQAGRPVFIAGRGAWHAEAEVARVAAACGALLATSAVAKGLFRGDPYSLGISGGFASPLAAELIGGADLLVSWGCALNMWTTRHDSLVGDDTTVVQVDDDRDALGAHRPIHLGVRADVGVTAQALAEVLDGTVAGYRTDAIRDRIARQGRWNDVATEDISTDTSIDARVLSARLDEILPVQRTVAIDSGNFMGYPSAYLSVPDVAAFCFTQAYQSIGLGLATSIGAALARPDRLCVAALGDGGFLMGVSELETAVRAGLHLLVVVYNDDAYGAEVHHFGRAADLSTVTFPPRDLAALARGFGAEGVTARAAADLEQVSEWLRSGRRGVLVVDARISDDGGSWWLAEAFRGH